MKQEGIESLGGVGMAGEWKRTSLREAGVTLIDCDHRTPPAADSGYPYVAIPQIKEGRLALSDVRRISPQHFVQWKAVKPEKAAEIRFQNIATARDRVKEQFGLDIAAKTAPAHWALILRAFQKRHLVAHKMGVVDENYLAATGESPSLLGRKVSITSVEARELVAHLQMLGAELFCLMEAKV
jgi:hypothetical protein